MFKSDVSRQAAWLTLGVWVMSGMLFAATTVVVGRQITFPLFVCIIVLNAQGVVVSWLLYLTSARTRQRSALIRISLMVGVTLVLSAFLSISDPIVMEIIRATMTPEIAPPKASLGLRAAASFITFVWILGMLAAIYLTVQANAVVRERERQLAAARTAASEAEAAASAARLAALRYQLNPHFLFNTLNAVSAAVITQRTDEAETMLSKLADFLRVTLIADPEALTSLEDEMATLQAYLEIESVRFRERLALEFICPDDLRGAMIPSFLLQPLIENAIKHAVSPTSATVTIRLEAVRDGEELVVLVQDDGDGAEGGEAAVRPGAGVGLRNIRMRLETLYGPRGVLQATPLAQGFLAMVRLPLQWASAAPSLPKAA